MGSSLAGVITLVALGLWHLRTRRHPNWSTCPDGRFYITIGYPAVVIAVYWLLNSPTATGLEWALGNLWALGAMSSFVYGFNALDAESERQPSSDLRHRVHTASRRPPSDAPLSAPSVMEARVTLSFCMTSEQRTPLQAEVIRANLAELWHRVDVVSKPAPPMPTC